MVRGKGMELDNCGKCGDKAVYSGNNREIRCENYPQSCDQVMAFRSDEIINTTYLKWNELQAMSKKAKTEDGNLGQEKLEDTKTLGVYEQHVADNKKERDVENVSLGMVLEITREQNGFILKTITSTGATHRYVFTSAEYLGEFIKLHA